MKGTVKLAAALALACGVASAGDVSGTLYYTLFSGAPNIWSVNYSYVGGVFSVATPNSIAATNGADGIIFSPNGDLLVGGQGSGQVHQITTGGTSVADGAAGSGSYHLALDPSGTLVYTSDFEGQLDALPLVGGVVQNGASHVVHGDDSGITGEAFTPSNGAFYVDGNPNANGNVGHLDVSDLNNVTTTRLFTTLLPAHGIVYDPFTSLITLFGDGAVATFDPAAGSDPNIIASLKQRTGINCDFDQGAVDGQGHALIAGCSQITFIDYSASGDITSALNPTFFASGFSNIDDVAPLTGLGANTPEPASFLLFGTSLLGLGYLRKRSLA